MAYHGRSIDVLRQKILDSASEMERRRLVALSGLSHASGVNGKLRHCERVLNNYGRRQRCNRPLCPTCGERMRNRRTKKTILKTCERASTSGYTVAHLTVALPPVDDLDRLRPIFQSAKRKLAGCRLRLRSRNPQDLSIAAEGQMEIALVPDDQLAFVGEGRRRTLTELGFPVADFGGPVWCPHLHLLLLVPPGTTVYHLGDELRRVFRAWRQVHIEPIQPGQGFVRGVYRVSRYGAKFTGRTEVEAARQRNWTSEEVALLMNWTERHSPRGRRGLTISFGMNTLPKGDGPACHAGESRETADGRGAEAYTGEIARVGQEMSSNAYSFPTPDLAVAEGHPLGGLHRPPVD